MQRMNSTFMF